jgi:hypothetical protein
MLDLWVRLQYILSKTWQSAALDMPSAIDSKTFALALQTTCAVLLSKQARNEIYDVPSTALFDFGDVELKQVVQPSDKFLSKQTQVSRW